MRNGSVLLAVAILLAFGEPANAQELRISGKVGLVCHQVEGIKKTSGNPPATVHLNHHFGAETYSVGAKITIFCSVAGPSPSDASVKAGLACYPIKKQPRFGDVKTVTVVQEADLKVKRASLWCLPSRNN